MRKQMKLILESVSISTILAVLAMAMSLVVSRKAPAAVPDAAPAIEQAPTISQTGDSAAKAKAKAKKSTEVNFDDVLVQGKYHFSDEAVTTVEQDKVLDALLGVRTDFKDRLSKSAARH